MNIKKSRKEFIKAGALLSLATLAKPSSLWASTFQSTFLGTDFVSKRPPISARKFTSDAVENFIKVFCKKLNNPELEWLFTNTFPNTLDTTVEFGVSKNSFDTYVITGDIDAMWLRDSTAQIWQYLPLMKKDIKLQNMIQGVINRQVHCIQLDRYANAFYKDDTKISEWKNDRTDMKPGVHERKWELDSLCYPIRLSYQYWQLSGDTTPFTAEWKDAASLILKTFKEQQRKDDLGPYFFERDLSEDTNHGFGSSVKPVGLIASSFRPSDDRTKYLFLVPSNFFAVHSLNQMAQMLKVIYHDDKLASSCNELADEVEHALWQYAIVPNKKFGKIMAYEVDGLGNTLCMDDANIPSLMSLPYLGCVSAHNAIYQNTRAFALSEENPYFYTGTVADGIGSPHTGNLKFIWPLAIAARGLTSHNEHEIKQSLQYLIRSNAHTGFMHESFDPNDATIFTRKWFAWANSLFSEFVIRVF
ncbi:MAG: glycoside hydrolase family 125 protein [Phycisphaerales bacterium]|nr:glycoside hydrolase family 125 protein [Phycisphaerales bacterium]